MPSSQQDAHQAAWRLAKHSTIEHATLACEKFGSVCMHVGPSDSRQASSNMSLVRVALVWRAGIFAFVLTNLPAEVAELVVRFLDVPPGVTAFGFFWPPVVAWHRDSAGRPEVRVLYSVRDVHNPPFEHREQRSQSSVAALGYQCQRGFRDSGLEAIS